MEIKGKRSNGELLALCEKCDDKTGHMSVNLKKRLVHCFKCGYSRALKIEEVAVINNNNRYHTSITHLRVKETLSPVHEDMKKLADLPDSPIIRQVKEYAKKRGFDPSADKLLYSYRMPYYMIIPVGDFWQGRAIKDNITPKNLFPTGLPNDQMYYVQGSPDYNQIVLCEGIMDARACKRKGRLSIALFGSIIKKNQIIKLAKLTQSFKGDVIVFLDGDAIKKAVKIAIELKMRIFPNIKVVIDRYLGDPDSITLELREQLIQRAQPVLDSLYGKSTPWRDRERCDDPEGAQIPLPAST